MDDIIVKLAENVVETSYENLPREAVESTKKAVLDILGVLIAGAPDCQREVDLVREWEGKAESTIFFYGGKVPAPNAAWVNGVMASACDFDGGMGAFHETACIVPAALAASEISRDINGRELITAIILAEDLAVRITEACRGSGGPDKTIGFHQGGTIAIFGTAAVSAKILGLDLRGMLNALGIVYTHATGTHQVAADKVLAVRMTGGFVTRSGVEAAILAQRGLTGVKNVMQGTFGLFNLFFRGEADLNALTDQLGKKFPIKYHTKRYPHCGTTQAATLAALKLARENKIDPGEIIQIIVEVSPGVYPITGQPFRLGENPRVEGQFHLAYTVANALVRKDSKLEHFTEEYVRDPRVVELAHKVHPIVNTNITALSAFVEIEMRDGSKYSKYESEFPQLSSLPEIQEKFRECVAFGSESIAKRNGEKIIDMVNKLEEINDISELIKLLIQD